MSKTASKNLVIRADSDSYIGTGHVMRCLALAQAWQLQGGQAVFISRIESEALCQRIESSGIKLIRINGSHPDPDDLGITLEILGQIVQRQSASEKIWLAIDGYNFDDRYFQAVRAAGCHLLVIDDLAALPHYHADVLLNQNFNAEQLNYSCETETQRLLGTRYALLRPEFLRWRDWQRTTRETANRILVTLGGSDPDNITLKVIQALQQIKLPALEAKIIVGPANTHLETLREVAYRSEDKIQILTNVNNMPELMTWADVAVSAGGSTCWELAFMGVPILVTVIAENQQLIAESLCQKGIAVNLGTANMLLPDIVAQTITDLLNSAERRDEMTVKSRGLVDGEGADRAVMALTEESLRLRRAKESDCLQVWEWANAPDVRAVSFSSEPIPWENHVQWFRSKLTDQNCLYYIAVNSDDQPVGQIRFDVKNKEAVISISLDITSRGKGYGSKLIHKASEYLQKNTKVDLIHAWVKQGNESSLRAFTKAGYKMMTAESIQGQQAAHFILNQKEQQCQAISQ